jgi:hypothetical protein
MRDPNVIQHREIFEQPDVLERAGYSTADDLVSLMTDKILAFEYDFPFGWPVNACDQVKHGGLPGAIGADDRYEFTGLQLEVEILYRPQTAKIVSDML